MPTSSAMNTHWITWIPKKDLLDQDPMALKSATLRFQGTKYTQTPISVNNRRSSLLSRNDSTRYYPPHAMQQSIPSAESPVSAVSRTASQMSTFTLPRTQSPYQGASGPSHPYGMYPQDIDLIRTPSMATTSTIRPRERSYAGPSGPNQPYSMYPQNTVPEDESGSAEGLQPPGMIGFPGRSNDYRRRLGPDVEDADDLVGPDGYTEQLPPYTRWPDNIPPKGGAVGAASILSAERGRTDNSEETLANPFQSRESLTHAVERDHSSTQLTVVAGSEPPQGDEGGSFKERVKHTSQKRTCFGRVPLWLIAVLALVLIAVLAGTIGGVVGHARGEQQATPSVKPPTYPPQPAADPTMVTTITTTSLVDATPLPSTPVNLPTLPTGVFHVPLRNPSISNNSCLSSHTNSWSCANGADLKLDLSVPNMISVSPLVPTQPNQVYFGPQPPDLTIPVPLSLMGDRDGMEKGPAWWFQQPYTKVVVVPGVDFNAGGGTKKRWFDLPRDRKDNRRVSVRNYGYGHTVATPAMKPWFCYWNSTILEGFIYVTQNSSMQSSSESAESASPTSPTPAYPSIYIPPSFAAFTSFPPTAATPTGTVDKRQVSNPSSYAAYSKDVKIEERRAPGTQPPPYCVHMQIMNDGTANPIGDENGQPITVQLEEIQPGSDGSVSQDGSGGRKRGNLWERGPSSTSSCECEWINS
ncbi:MAG: hypothetical protein Q9220_000175 [cf. Caloplaca sp. 1 TL-2023]